MYEWSEEQQMVQQAVRDFVDKEIRPHREELEFGDMPPYDLLRKLFKTFGMSDMQRSSFAKRIGCQAAQMPSESEPIEAKPSFFGPTKQTPAAQKPTREGSEAAPCIGLDPHGSGPGACLARRPRRLLPAKGPWIGPRPGP